MLREYIVQGRGLLWESVGPYKILWVCAAVRTRCQGGVWAVLKGNGSKKCCFPYHYKKNNLIYQINITIHPYIGQTTAHNVTIIPLFILLLIRYDID